jgi:hypothetical protein
MEPLIMEMIEEEALKRDPVRAGLWQQALWYIQNLAEYDETLH